LPGARKDARQAAFCAGQAAFCAGQAAFCAGQAASRPGKRLMGRESARSFPGRPALQS